MAKGKKTGGRLKGSPNRDRRQLRTALQKHEKPLLTALLKLTKSKDERVRFMALKECLDRAYGKPAQAVEVSGDPDSPVIFQMYFGAGLKK